MSRHTTSAAKAGGLDYVLDLTPPDALYARLIRARGPHSLVSVDRDSLRARPGVVAVLDHADDPGRWFSTNPVAVREDMQVFSDEARHPGDVVGAVVAETRRAARSAAALPVTERELAAAVSLDEALAAGAPPVHTAFGDTNVLAMLEFGAPEDVVHEQLAASELVFDHTYTTAAASHNFLEPPAAIASWDGEGDCRVVSNAQLPHLNRELLAALLGVDLERLEYVSPPIGGSFGGKEDFALDLVAALCSRAVGGRPVVVESDRRETTATVPTRHAMHVRVRSGCSADGRLTARLIEATAECGPYAGHSSTVMANGLSIGMTLYPAPAVRGVGRCVALNRVPGGAYRGYGGTQVLFAVESQLDEIAGALALDPFTLRKRNALQAGARDPAWGWPVSFDLDTCLDRCRTALGMPGGRGEGRYRRGWGIAALGNISGLTGPMGTDSAEVSCSVDEGRLTITTASADIGQGLHAALVQVAAAELELPPELVDVVCDPRLADLGTAASRGSYLTANAALAAVQGLRAAAAERHAGDRPLVSRGRLDPALDGLSATRTFAAPDNGLVAGTQLVEVEVDCETGRVRPLRVVSVHDSGRVLSATRAQGQVRGGVLHGLGMALAEQLSFDESGAVVDPTLLGQGLPPADWELPIEALFVDDPHPNGGLGVKGLGEAPAMGIMPALANAICDATGARLRSAPFTPERVLAAIVAAREPAESVRPA